MSNKIVLHAQDLDGFLREDDKKKIKIMDDMYKVYLQYCKKYDEDKSEETENLLINQARAMGKKLKELTSEDKNIHVYSFETPKEQHAAASRLINKLREQGTTQAVFLYYIQRAYEMMFNHVYTDKVISNKTSIITKTPVNIPNQNYAVHRIPDVNSQIENSVMCVMLRGALLPSMILSKEIEEYSRTSYITPFALFSIKRNDLKNESNMDYILDLDRSFFDLKSLDGKDLIFADPMNATGGSLVTILTYLKKMGVKYKSVKFINVIGALKGSLRIIRAIENCEVHTLWMDPVLNEKAYILPGLGDAGDRLNGRDPEEYKRNMIQLISDYGTNINNLYRTQVREIERTVLEKNI